MNTLTGMLTFSGSSSVTWPWKKPLSWKIFTRREQGEGDRQINGAGVCGGHQSQSHFSIHKTNG